MKALSIREPWASLIVSRKKTMEIRFWSKANVTKAMNLVSREILIHASQTWDHAGANALLDRGIDIEPRHNTSPGYIIGVATLAEVAEFCHLDEFSDRQKDHLNDPSWWHQKYGVNCIGLCFTFARPVPHVAVRGSLGFFEVEGF